MKLLIVSEGYYPQIGGLEKIVTELAECLVKDKGYEVDVITLTDAHDTRTETIRGVNILYLPLSARHGKKALIRELLRARRAVRRRLREKQYDMVSLQYLGYMAAVYYFSRPKGQAYTVSIHGSDIMGLKNAVIRSLIGKITAHAQTVISNSNYLLEKLKELTPAGGFPREKVIWNGIHLERFQPAKAPCGRERVVAVGRFVQKKGFDILIRAFQTVARHRPEAELLLIGDGAERGGCEKLAQELGLEGRVTFAGRCTFDETMAYLRQSEIYVRPSRAEAFGIVVLEGLATGLPMVLTACGGAEEIVEGYDCGYIVPPEDPQAMAEKILALLQDENTRARFRENGLKRVRAFSFDRFVDQYDQVWNGEKRDDQ